MDQAIEPGRTQGVRVISVTSGKGGVGKTNTVANLALALGQLGKKVLVLDADLGLANMDILLGLTPRYNICHVFSGEKELSEIIVEGPGGLRIIPASSGIQELAEIDERQKLVLLSEFDSLSEDVDFFLIDTAAGISSNVMYFNVAAQERIVIVTGEPTSMTDAYATIKVLLTKYHEQHFKLLVNGVGSARKAEEVYRKLSVACDRFLGSPCLDYLGFIPYDENIPKAVARQKAVIEAYPRSQSSRSFVHLARKVCQAPTPTHLHGNIRFFWQRLFTLGNNGKDWS